MPVDLHHNFGNGILYISVTDPFTPEDLNSTLREITRSEQYPPHTPTLWDMREVAFTHYDKQLEMEFIKVRKRYPNRGRARIAFVVKSDLAFGMMRMYETLSELNDLPQNIRILRDYKEGESWLMNSHPPDNSTNQQNDKLGHSWFLNSDHLKKHDCNKY